MNFQARGMIPPGERFGIRTPTPLYVVWLLSVTADICQHASEDVRILAAATSTRADTLLRLALQDHGGDRHTYFWDQAQHTFTTRLDEAGWVLSRVLGVLHPRRRLGGALRIAPVRSRSFLRPDSLPWNYHIRAEMCVLSPRHKPYSG